MPNEKTNIDLLETTAVVPSPSTGQVKQNAFLPLDGGGEVGVDKPGILESDTAFRLLKDLEANPSITQRTLAEKHQISLGKTNYIMSALIDKGIIKAQNFKNSKNKAAYMYVLTPEGAIEKARIAKAFMARKLAEYERLRAEIAQYNDENLEIVSKSTAIDKVTT